MDYILWCMIGGCAGAVLAGLWFQNREKLLLKRIEKMIGDSKNGCFVPLKQDETLLSSVENSMSQLLEGNWVSEKRLRKEKQKTQTLISDISHQTITPISNILLYSQLLEEQVKNTELEGSAEAIGHQAEKLSFLIESLVKASRLETGIIQTEARECDPQEIVQQAILQIEAKLRKKNMGLEFHRAEECAGVVCDPKWTAEALFNLLDNAVKYTPEGGKIQVRVQLYSMFCRIDIADSGIGMEEQELAKVFHRFYRGTGTADEEGVGLGLYLAREIIGSQKGYIKAASTPGKGSCFSVFLIRRSLKGSV